MSLFSWLVGLLPFSRLLVQLIFLFLLCLLCLCPVLSSGLSSAVVVLEGVLILLKNKRAVIPMSNIYQLIVPVLLFMIFLRLGDKNRA